MARLLSVNVGLPQDIAWRGRTVHTAVWKRAVMDRRTARRSPVWWLLYGARDGTHHPFAAESRAEACDVPVRWSCRTGVRHRCESGLVSGAVGYGPDPLELPPGGNMLICCSRPLADVVIDL